MRFINQYKTLRIGILVLMALLSFLVFYTPNNQFNYNKLSVPVVRISGTDWIGTGFLISSDGYIVTCNHVIEEPKIELVEDKAKNISWWPWGKKKKKKEDDDGLLPEPKNIPDFKKPRTKKKLTITYEDQKDLSVELYGIPGLKIKPTIVWQNRVFDIAILKIYTPAKLPYLKLSEKEPQIGEKLYVVGHPLNFSWSGYETSMAGRIFNIASVYYYTLGNTLTAGISGSPIVDGEYKVVCVAESNFGGKGFPNITACVPSTAIKWAARAINLNL